MRRLISSISILTVALLQIVQSVLGVVTQTYEERSEFAGPLLTLTTLAPLLSSLFIVDSVRVTGKYRWLDKSLALSLTIYTLGSCFFSLYRIGRKFTFDFFWLWYNLADAYRTVVALDERVPLYALGFLLIATLHYLGLTKIFSRLGPTRASRTHTGPMRPNQLKLWTGLVLFVGTHAYVDNEPSNVVIQAMKSTPPAASLYVKYFEDSLIQNKNNSPSSGNSTKDRNLFFIHLESLNARWVNPSVTPNLIRHASQDGIFFPQIQAPSVLTIRAQETLLCSVLPALKQNISIQKDVMDGLVCLPKILQRRGFKTLYFHSYPHFDFSNLDGFMKVLGFDELHAADIMKPEDKLLSWGYAEDVYYRRVFEFLERYRGQKIFAYIGVSSTNHFPFYDKEKRVAFPQFTDAVPYPRPNHLGEELANTTYIQDRFFGDMYERFYQPRFSANSHMIAFGDHSYPIGIHKNNFYSENHAFQENFATSLAIFPAAPDRSRYKVGAQVKTLHSYLDLLPTVLEMYGIGSFRYYGQSFLEDSLISGREKPARCAVAVQPFSGGFITIINYPHKHIFKLSDNTVTTYDLSRDPDEASILTKQEVDSESLKILEKCVQSLKP
jgi:arylsulfatase A-like enzyme